MSLVYDTKINNYMPFPSKMPGALTNSQGYKYRNIAINNDYVWDIVWCHTPQQINDTVNNYIRDYNALITAILALPDEQQTFGNTFVLFDDFTIRNQFDIHRIIFLQHVSENEEIRKASTAAEKKLREFFINTNMRDDLYQLTLKIYEREASNLQGEDLLFLNDQMRDNKRNGLHLDKETKEKLKSLNEKLANLCSDFSMNIAADKTTIQFTRKELDGLPETFFNNLEYNDDKYTLKMKYPHVLPVLDKAHYEKTRQEMERAFNSRCRPNMAILFNILQLRKEIANLLGYSTWSDYTLEINMAKSVNVVKGFLTSLVDKLTILRDKELEKMAKRKGGPIQAYDLRYFSELDKIENYNIDSEKVREYFPLNHVLTNMFRYYEQLLGLRFTRGLKDTWHQDAWEWLVYDKSENKIIGKFYLDLYPRDNKFTHAACFPLKFATHADPYAVCAMLCNFRKPTDNLPSLLSHSEVETLYHEFGHVMHNICARTYYLQYSGTQTSRDFVEAPSQMLENWCWEYSTIKELSKHYSTGEPMPDDMIKKIISSRYANSGLTNCRQLTLGIVDLLLHTQKINSEEDIYKLYEDVCINISGLPNTPGTCKLATFGHIAGGYDSQYYGYMWSKVFADDIYNKLKADLEINPNAGIKYRNKVLAWGGSRDAYQFIQEYLEREPEPSAFFRNLGL
jgi:thimet oligopeptidase